MKRITRKEFEKAIKLITDYEVQMREDVHEFKKRIITVHKFAGVIPDDLLLDTDISVRVINQLKGFLSCYYTDDKGFSDTTVKDLSEISIQELTRGRNIGRKTIEEIQELCFYAGTPIKLRR